MLSSKSTNAQWVLMFHSQRRGFDLNDSSCNKDAEIVAELTLSRHHGLEIPLPAHLIFISIVDVGQVQHINLMSDDKVLIPC